ncbi:hypothetical protein M9H77_19370 [Catharanthus roseus]|uniref:Uncharacterized protein n=1 Tax=Catharanthus roseus TaxID=4058 RepID=A0ACC0BA87_CATRO|nr:hypothetical protein M9H77_19370 [Catharanthus roseus]
MEAAVNALVVEAFDIKNAANVANDVYEQNFGHRPYQGNIQSLSAADLNVMRLTHGSNLHLVNPLLGKCPSGPRASFFLIILELQTLVPPFILFVENVIGFVVDL